MTVRCERCGYSYSDDLEEAHERICGGENEKVAM